MKQILALLLAVASLGACSHEDFPEASKAKVDRTILVYMVANNNLEDELYSNVVDMYKGLQQVTDSCTLLIFWDGKESGSFWPTPRILRYVTDGKGKVNNSGNLTTDSAILSAAEAVKVYSSLLSTDKTVMTQVLKDMVAISPSESYGFIGSSHSSGWLKSIFGTNSRSFGQDGDYTENTIQIPDMVEALKAPGVKYDFMLFDTCMMGCAEVYYELRDITKYCIASVIDVPGTGFPYDEMLQYLYGNSVEAYAKACKTYIDWYNNLNKYQGIKFGTISLVDCEEMENLASTVKEQIVSHISTIETYTPYKLQYYGDEGSNYKYYSFDMLQFIEELNGGTAPEVFKEQLSKTVLYTDYVKDTYIYQIDGDHYCGMGLYIPLGNKYYWNGYFKTLSWFSAAGWNETVWAN